MDARCAIEGAAAISAAKPQVSTIAKRKLTDHAPIMQ